MKIPLQRTCPASSSSSSLSLQDREMKPGHSNNTPFLDPLIKTRAYVVGSAAGCISSPPPPPRLFPSSQHALMDRSTAGRWEYTFLALCDLI